MLRTALVSIIAALITIAAAQAVHAVVQRATQASPSAVVTAVPAGEAARIRQATVRITMYSPVQQRTTTDARGQTITAETQLRESGLGTLVSAAGQTQIVTHDHWPTLDTGLERVEIADAWGKPLVTLSAADLFSLIYYRDGGTIVMSAPAAVAERLAAVEWETHAAAGAGDIVYVTRQQPGDGKRTEVIAAKVESDGLRENRPIYNLRTIGGQVITPGDSGGGVWLNGRLAGNMWGTAHDEITVKHTRLGISWTTTEICEDGCVAAQLTDAILESVQDVSTTAGMAAESDFVTPIEYR